MNSLNIKPEYILLLFSWLAGIQFAQAENTVNSMAPTIVETNILQTSTSLTIADVSANEDDGTVSISVILNNIVLGGFSVDVNTETGSATPQDGDFTAISSRTLTFLGLAGETISFTVNLGADNKVEADETFIVSMDNVRGPLISADDVDASDTGTVTISNDDEATVLIEDVSGNEGGGAITLTATLDHAVDGGFTVGVNTANGTASAGTDFTALSGETLTFSGTAGEAHNFTVTPIDDSETEPDETLTVSMNNLVTGTVASGAIDVSDEAVVTIEDDDTQPTVQISVDDVTLSEGNSESALTFTVTLDQASGSSVTVDYATSGGTATSGSDFVETSGTLSFAAGETSKSIPVTIPGDQTVERDETFTITLSNPTGQSSISDGSGTGTISNDDEATVLIEDVSGNEGGGAITLTATLDHAVDGGFTVDVNTANGTASAGTDFTALSGETLTFSGTAGEAHNFTVTPIDDSETEPDETLTVSMNNLVTGTVASGAIDVSDEAVVTIEDDDTQPTVQISVDDVTLSEGNSESALTFTVTLDQASGSSVTVDYATSGGTATSGSDFVETSGTLSFAAGETSKSIPVTIPGDQTVERDETFTITLSNPTGQSSISDGSGTGTISNDDEATVLIEDVSGNEGGGAITLTATLDHAVDGGFTVDVNTANGTASAGTDFTALSGETLTFSGTAGEAHNFTVTPIDDSETEPDETLTVSMNNLVTGTVASGAIDVSDEAVVTIEDDDTQPTVQISVNDVTVSEGNTESTLTFTVSLNESSGSSVTVDYATSGGTATSGSDFVETSGTLSFAAGETSKSIPVTIPGDQTVERDETFTITLSNPTGQSSISDGSGTGTISNDDEATVLIEDVSGNEGGGAITLTATLDHAVDGGFTVDLNTANGTATAGTDFTALSGETLTFSGTAGETHNFTVTPIDDSETEPDETLTVSMNNLVPGTVASGAIDVSDEAVVTIEDDDQSRVFVEDVSETEDKGDILVTMVLNRAVSGGFSLQASTSDGTARAGQDYEVVAKTFTFKGEQDEKKILKISTIDDDLDEENETLFVSLSSLNGPKINISDQGHVTIVDDDHTPVVADQVFEINESMENGVELGTIQASDDDQGTTFSNWKVLNGNEAGLFALESNTGTLSVADISQLNTSRDEYILSVSVSDGTNTSEAASVTVNVVSKDETGPAVTLTSEVSEVTNQQEVMIVATFDEAVSGFDQADITAINSEASDISTDDYIVYTFTALASSDGTVAVSIPASSAQDEAGNWNRASNKISYFYDGTKPTATLSLDQQNQIPEATIFIDFSESITGLSQNDFELTTGSISSLSGSLNAYTLEVTNIIEGQTTVTLVSGAVSDEAGNTNDAVSITINDDVTGPTEFVPSFVDPIVNAVNQESISFQILYTEEGSTYTYQVVSGDSSETIEGSASSMGGKVVEDGFDLSNFPDGEIILIVTMSDEVGNVGSTKTDRIIKDTSFDIPQGISPNGDGANDTWVIPGIENFPQNRVTIFNRWGNQVYQMIGYDNRTKVFEGQSNNDFSLGNTLSNGTYFYVIDLSSEDVRKGYLIINK